MLLSLMPVGMNCVGDFREQTSVTNITQFCFLNIYIGQETRTNIYVKNRKEGVLTSPAAIVNMCGVKFWPAEPASTTPIWANKAAAQEQCQHPNIDKKQVLILKQTLIKEIKSS
jgi:hypothetical protein